MRVKIHLIVVLASILIGTSLPTFAADTDTEDASSVNVMPLAENNTKMPMGGMGNMGSMCASNGGKAGSGGMCPMMGQMGMIGIRLPPGNEKLQLQMQAEMMQKMGEILSKYAAKLPDSQK